MQSIVQSYGVHEGSNVPLSRAAFRGGVVVLTVPVADETDPLHGWTPGTALVFQFQIWFGKLVV